MLLPDFWHDLYNEDKDWPVEYKEWFSRTLAWDKAYKYVKGLIELRDALQDEEEDRNREKTLVLLMQSAAQARCS